jgi:hypothetical protein
MGEYRKGHRDRIVLPRESVGVGHLITFGGANYTVILVGDWSDIYDRVELDRPLEEDIYTGNLRVVGVFDHLKHQEATLTLRVISLETSVKEVKEHLEKLRVKLTEACLAEGGHFDNGGFIYGFCTRCGEFLG